MTRYISILILVTLCPIGLWSGVTGKIAGNIIDQSTGDPLPGVKVTVEGLTTEAVTDSSGYYFILNIPPGRFNLEAGAEDYQNVIMTGVLISSDHTTTIDYHLKATELEVVTVKVKAPTELIRMDQTSSVITIRSNDILEIPTVRDLDDFMNTQVGIENMLIRGGGLDQIELQIDGMSLVDFARNRPLTNLINPSAVQELRILKGGFSAEYGNIRSGVIDVITKSGSPSTYHGSVILRIAPPQRKHGGLSLVDTMNYYLRPYFDPEVAFVGTDEGWADRPGLRESYPEWEGWNDWLQRQPELGQTAQQAQDLFRWLRAAEGTERFGLRPNRYWDKPDRLSDLSLSGPIPLISKSLGNMTFLVSYKNNEEMFALPLARDYLTEESSHLKLTSRFSQSTQLTAEALYSETRSIAEPIGRGAAEVAGFLEEATDALYLKKFSSTSRTIFVPTSMSPGNFTSAMQGITLNHVFNPGTHFSLRLSNIRTNFFAGEELFRRRDPKEIYQFGDVPVESPYGWPPNFRYSMYMGDFSSIRLPFLRWEESRVSSFELRFDLTSRVNGHNQIKTGFLFHYDDLDIRMQNFDMSGSFGLPGYTDRIEWRHFPYRIGAYFQDNLEVDGMTANIGLRLDVNEPNTNWYTLDRYHRFFGQEYGNVFQKLMVDNQLVEPAKGEVRISPRLTISHPIAERSRIYFNYGHFYSMAPSGDMYTFRSGRRIEFLGNPSARMPRTIAYEIGFEHMITKTLSVEVTGYSKDVSDQTGTVEYIDYDQTVSYSTIENNHYADIRGIEVKVDKQAGQWVTGWLSYSYRLEKSGYVGRKTYYEDLRVQLRYGLVDPHQLRPIPRPFARGVIRFSTPKDWGLSVAGVYPVGGWSLSWFWQWKSGRYETWDPLTTYELKDNLHWKDEHYVDMRLEKRASFGTVNIGVFMDITNVFDLRYISPRGFGPGNDTRNYLASLHIPMYEGQEYQDEGFMPGDDQAGDRRSKEKPYINMPNRKFMTYLNPRRFEFGIRIDF